MQIKLAISRALSVLLLLALACTNIQATLNNVY